MTRSEWIFAILFLLTLPLVNPWIRGDGVGYYAFVRAPLIEHSLDFRHDWYDANSSYRLGRIDDNNNIYPNQYTATGHLNNHFSIGPAILWAPFLIVAHLGVLTSDMLGAHIAADGFSLPYRLAMAVSTALYGFLGLCISFRWARKYVPEHWAFVATLAVWFASSLPVYMYFNPSWSHAQSAFVVALYLWYWDATRPARTWWQWFVLGLVAALMCDVYYVSALLMSLPLMESIGRYWNALQAKRFPDALRLFGQNVMFALVVASGIFPTLLVKKVIYGGFFKSGYTELWFWNSPAILKVGFSSEHGLFSWTPVLLLAVIGLFFLHRYDRNLSIWLIVAFGMYMYVIGSYESWDGISSFGNRFFVSLTPVFILGLAALLDTLARAWTQRSATVFARCAVAALVLWNLGLIYQWGTHLIPARGPISWREAAYNQVAVVPEEAGRTVYRYMTERKNMMRRIEQEDVGHLKATEAGKAH